jgi:hypothetical protein
MVKYKTVKQFLRLSLFPDFMPKVRGSEEKKGKGKKVRCLLHRHLSDLDCLLEKERSKVLSKRA